MRRDVESGKGAKHVDVPMRKVDEAQDAEDHRVAAAR